MVICCSLVKYGRFLWKLDLVRATFRAEGFSRGGRFPRGSWPVKAGLPPLQGLFTCQQRVYALVKGFTPQ